MNESFRIAAQGAETLGLPPAAPAQARLHGRGNRVAGGNGRKKDGGVPPAARMRCPSHLLADRTLRPAASRSLPRSTWVPSLRAIHLDPAGLRWELPAMRWEGRRMCVRTRAGPCRPRPIPREETTRPITG